MVTIPSSAYGTNLTRNLSLEINGNNNLRDASFSSYLNANEDNFISRLAESSRNLKPVVLNLQEDPHYSAMAGMNVPEDGEIAVFGAEKYFKGDMDQDESPKLVSEMSSKTRKSLRNDERTVVSPPRSAQRAAVGTPSVRSESSWNSQKALLKKALRNFPRRSNASNSKCKIFFANLGCKCSCSDNNSADVDERASETTGATNKKLASSPSLVLRRPPSSCLDEASRGNGSNRENCFTFPTTNLDVKTKSQGHEEDGVVLQRKSLEVFGSPIVEKRIKSLSVERKLAILSWGSNPRTQDHEPNDNDSDASSDLFEIESLTGKPKKLLASQETEEPSGCTTPTNGYAPSEASIEWSVVTASAADFSVASDYEDLRSYTSRTNPAHRLSSKNLPGAKGKPRRSSGLLSGCKSQKAVRVSGDAYRAGYQPHQDFRDIPRFPAEGSENLPGLESRNRILRSGRPVTLSPSPRPLYIQ